jgi:hypothetical protein
VLEARAKSPLPHLLRPVNQTSASELRRQRTPKDEALVSLGPDKHKVKPPTVKEKKLPPSLPSEREREKRKT